MDAIAIPLSILNLALVAVATYVTSTSMRNTKRNAQARQDHDTNAMARAEVAAKAVLQVGSPSRATLGMGTPSMIPSGLKATPVSTAAVVGSFPRFLELEPQKLGYRKKLTMKQKTSQDRQYSSQLAAWKKRRDEHYQNQKVVADAAIATRSLDDAKRADDARRAFDTRAAADLKAAGDAQTIARSLEFASLKKNLDDAVASLKDAEEAEDEDGDESSEELAAATAVARNAVASARRRYIAHPSHPDYREPTTRAAPTPIPAPIPPRIVPLLQTAEINTYRALEIARDASASAPTNRSLVAARDRAAAAHKRAKAAWEASPEYTRPVRARNNRTRTQRAARP